MRKGYWLLPTLFVWGFALSCAPAPKPVTKGGGKTGGLAPTTGTVRDFQSLERLPDIREAMGHEEYVGTTNGPFAAVVASLTQAAQLPDDDLEAIYRGAIESDKAFDGKVDFLLGLLSRIAFRVEDLAEPIPGGTLTMAAPKGANPLWPMKREGDRFVIGGVFKQPDISGDYLPEAERFYQLDALAVRRYPAVSKPARDYKSLSALGDPEAALRSGRITPEVRDELVTMAKMPVADIAAVYREERRSNLRGEERRRETLWLWILMPLVFRTDGSWAQPAPFAPPGSTSDWPFSFAGDTPQFTGTLSSIPEDLPSAYSFFEALRSKAELRYGKVDPL